MSVTRRRFLAVTALAFGAGVAASWRARHVFLPWLLSGALAPSPTGPLRESTRDVLRAAVLALLDDRVEPRHYVDTFCWRAEHVPGALALYERFERAVDRAAVRAGERGFRAASVAIRRRIVDGMRPAGGLTRARRILLDRDEARFARHIVREVFQRFAATDAWVLAGYDAWPGMPRAIARMAPPPERP